MKPPRPESAVFAAGGNRAAALVLDMVFLAFAVTQLPALPIPRWSASLALALLYFAGMPLSPLQGTPGKWICRIKLCTRDGARLAWRAAALRAACITGWIALFFFLLGNDPASHAVGALRTIFWFLVFLPFAFASFLPRGESLFDLAAGSLVVRLKADAASIAAAEALQKPGILNVIGAIVPCLVIGFVLHVTTNVQHDKDRRVRVNYAIGQTQALRREVAEYYVREGRWPTPAALGVAEWTPYPQGGGYRLQTDGSVVISFTVLPDLKGRDIVLRPAPMPKAPNFTWECKADAGLARGHLPPDCR